MAECEGKCGSVRPFSVCGGCAEWWSVGIWLARVGNGEEKEMRIVKVGECSYENKR